MYITWSDSTLRYPELAKLPDVSSASQAMMIALAEGAVNSRLAGTYTVPFSSNNLTAQDLSMDMLFVQTQTTRQPEKAKLLMESLNDRFDALISGSSSMVASDGTMIDGTIVTGDPVWSTTQDYHPTFGVGAFPSFAVSSQQQIDEDNARGIYPGEAS